MRTRPATAAARGESSRRSWLLQRYVRTEPPPPPGEIEGDLWVGDLTQHWQTRDATYYASLLEQYKIYVEMADRISARRGAANTYFLTLNTAASTVIGVFWQHPPRASAWVAVAPLLALLGQCAAWFSILRSYRQLNGAKYSVIGALEQRLPASPYWSAEWKALGKGMNPAQYWPLSHVEQWVPLFFALVYVTGFVILLST
jgi:hypothetical protein